MKVSTIVPALLCVAPGAVNGFTVGPNGRASSVRSELSMSSSEETVRNPNPAIKVAANAMSLLKPVFKLEAELQAAALGAIAKVDKDEVAATIEENKKNNKVLIYTYGLSPFSTEALAILDASGYDYTKIELGAEWFLLGGEGSETRVALSKEIESGATSLPKIFIGGECIGGCADLAGLVESGELDAKMKSAGVRKPGEKSPSFFDFFSK
mmetsp:Transcript_35089/g.71835  ORF Transcript_35089/g.71835 Transcript_35089/m.71835 type:complete len:211 (-) Transcript_35089:96-728(-)